MSATIEPIGSINYHFAQADIAGMEMGANVAGLNTTTALTQGGVEYYVKKADNGTNLDEGKGFVRAFGKAPGVPHPKSGKVFKELGVQGQEVSYQMAKDLGDGKHPDTGEVLAKGKKMPDGSIKRKVGYDIQLSLPKSASILWGLGMAAAKDGSNSGERYAKAVDLALERASQRVLQYCFDNGLIVARRSGATSGHESVAHVVAGSFRHSTSRSGDMQCHTHNVLFNVCLREDGSAGAIDNAKMKMHGRAIAALFHGEAAMGLKEACPELSIEVSGKSWEVGGVAEVLVDTFSKGRKRVLEGAKKMGIDDISKHREASIHINRNTRDNKANVPPISELLPRWVMEAASKGYTWASIVEQVFEAGEKRQREIAEDWAEKRAEAAERGEILPETPPALDLDQLSEKAFNSLTASNSVFEEKLILAELAEAMMTHAGIDAFEQVVKKVKESGKMLALGQRGDTVYYSTREVVETERVMIRNALSMKGNVAAVDPEIVQPFIDQGKVLPNGKVAYLRKEQQKAVRHMCSGDQIAIVRGRAGTGKSFSSGVVADIYRSLGFDIHGIAPSHAAKDVLKDDAEIAQELSRAATGFINDYESGKITLGPSSLILVDEFGMLGTDQVARIIAIAKERKALLRCMGDDFQLQPIANGAPMKVLTKPEVCGAFTMGEIVRQSGWQQKASVLMSEGNVAEGVSKYIEMGKVKFDDDLETAIQNAVDDYVAARLSDPEGKYMMQAIMNRTASEMNMVARERLFELGLIEGPETVIKSWTRGQNPRKTDIGFCKGDDIILGESFKYEGEIYANNLGGRVLDIRAVDGNEPVFTIKWNDGRTTALRPSEMVGYRRPNAKDKTTPKLAHGLARTVYSQQGSTYTGTFTVIDATPAAELTYVLLTRHKKDAKVYVDGGRYHDDIAARSGVKMSMDKNTGMTNEESMSAEVEVTAEMIQAQFLKDVQKSQGKLNASDFHDDVVAFAMGAEITRAADQIAAITSWMAGEISTEAAIQLARAEDEDQLNEWALRIQADQGKLTAQGEGEKKMAIEDDKPQQPKTASDFRGARNSLRASARFRAPEAAAHPTVVKTAERIEKKMAEVQATKSTKPKFVNDPAHSRVAKEEIAYMVRQDLRQLMLNDGATPDKKYKQGRETTSGGVEYSLIQANGEKTVVTRWKSGSWSFFNRGDQKSGDVVAYVKWRDGSEHGQALHKLRDYYGTLQNRVNTADLSPDSGSHKEVPLQDRLTELADKPYDAKKFDDPRGRWDALGVRKTDLLGNTTGGTGMPGYAIARGLERETLEPFANDIRLEGSKSFDGKNDRGIAIMMRDHNLNFTGFYRKGPSQKGELGIQWGSEHHATFMGNTVNPKRILAGETPFDCWSQWQMDGRPDAGRVAVSVTPGSYSHNAMADWMMHAKKHPDAEWHYCIQNDDPNAKTGIRANDVHRQRFEEAVLAGNPNAKIVYHKPDEAFKDWNDQLRNIPKASLKKDDVAKKPEPRVEERRQQPVAAQRPVHSKPGGRLVYKAVQEGPSPAEVAAQAEVARAAAEAARKAQEEAQRQQPSGPKL
ncbi:MobF family relaxase [Rhizobium laguerreae]|uniref:MobF family relaxase n=1 Tax=Rhizobium laguerreae TaxID=1076926 RepID=UPI001C910E86|nr:MobF family relaxase [Rhizobium laguerreae]MBY3314745.1 AAA family ATPase [Rhizobium laguerreae]